jgi:hypothetical protein
MSKSSFAKRLFGHLRTVTRHRRYVRKACFGMLIPWRGLKHDLSKFSPVEFWAGVRYYTGTKSPIDAEKDANGGVSYGWAHHRGHNDHHWEYWVDWNQKDASNKPMPYGVKMPYDAVIEMLCDFIGAGKAYNPKGWNPKDELAYFLDKAPHRIYNEETYCLFLHLLKTLASLNDEKAFFAWYRICHKTIREGYESGSGFSEAPEETGGDLG